MAESSRAVYRPWAAQTRIFVLLQATTQNRYLVRYNPARIRFLLSCAIPRGR